MMIKKIIPTSGCAQTNDTPIIPKPINSTTPLDEIHNHIREISQLLLEIGKNTDSTEQHIVITNARQVISKFEEDEIHQVQEAFEG